MAPEEANDDRGIVMWGAPSTGKTTFLAALSIALIRQDGSRPDKNANKESLWVRGVEKRDADALTSLTTQLVDNRVFPKATGSVEVYKWELVGTVQRSVPGRWFGRMQREVSVIIPLNLVDAPGGAAHPDSEAATPARWEELIGSMERSKGIILLFDPIREFAQGDAFTHTLAVVNELSYRMRASSLPGGRLPHYVAACVTKFDEIKVFETAERLEMIEFDDDQYCFPRVPQDEAREFFASLCAVSRSGDADMVLGLLEKTFRPDRIKYFVSSAIGFYLDPDSGAFNRTNFLNHLPRPDGTEESAGIRGPVHPINVVEPILWLGRQLSEETPQ